jgi:prepilin-type N-terminal cleavage/methylation domain-containing protein
MLNNLNNEPIDGRGNIFSEPGFTFLEMVIVIVIIGILSTVAMRAVDNALEGGRFESTVEEMDELVFAIGGNPELYSGGVRSDFGYFGDVGSLPANLDALVSNPGYGTWDGPYITRDFTQDPNGFKTDGWGDSYTYSGGVTITSNGGGSTITRNIADNASDLTSNTVNGVVVDGVGNPPGLDAGNVTVRITHPNGSGSTTTRTTSPNSSGVYSFSNVIPIGNHFIQAIYPSTSDTASLYVSVLPNSVVTANLRLPGNLWTISGGTLTIVDGSRTTTQSGRDVYFTVQNNTGGDVSITSIKAEYATTAYYERIIIGTSTVFQDNNPRGASGETKTFSSIDITSGGQKAIQITRNKDSVSGPGMNVDMRGTTYLITFSEGSIVAFVAGEDD